jgi:uroporphyrinogen decarboxylase
MSVNQHNIFENRPRDKKGRTQVPVWFMRQAGRYHSHYQNIKKNSHFMEMCKNPELACQVTLGPIQDFHFNAAILFSDLLFPLEHLGMGLNYLKGPPELAWHLQTPDDLIKLQITQKAEDFFHFQKQACKLLKKQLPADVTLLGFVGAPFTLYTYAVEGSHAGNLVSSKQGLFDGRYSEFCHKLLPELLTEMRLQAEGGAQAVALFDTAAGELSPFDYQEHVVPMLTKVIKEFKKLSPETKIIYYSKHTQLHHLKHLKGLPLDVLGIDWRCDLIEIQKYFPECYIQGNFDPIWLHLPLGVMEDKLRRWHQDLKARGLNPERWICGLGHGVTIQTPEANVRRAVQIVHDEFGY